MKKLKILILLVIPIVLQAQVFDKYDRIMFVNSVTHDTIVAKKEHVLIIRNLYSTQLILRIDGYDYDIKLIPQQYGFSTAKNMREDIERKLFPSYKRYYITNNVDDTVRAIRDSSSTLLIHKDTLIYRYNKLYKYQRLVP
jgi:hypothetical protein